VAGVGLEAHVGSAKALILLGDTSSMPTKLAVLEELVTTVGLGNYTEVDLTVPQRPALTPLSN
jgi:NADPH-dependent ferric siderophore reductase